MESTTTKALRAIAYIRVSTDRQADEGNGLDVQRQAITAWAKAGGHKIVDWFSDEQSGKDALDPDNGLTTRPGLSEAFIALEGGQADALVVYRLDRLARKLSHREVWIERQQSKGREVISVTEPGYGDDEMRTLVRQILGSVAEYERVVIAKRLSAGRAAKAAKGGYAYGAPPFGYRAEGKELAPDPGEQAILARIRRLRDGGASLRQVADTLNTEAVPARRGRWHSQTVARALERPQHGAGSARPAARGVKSTR